MDALQAGMQQLAGIEEMRDDARDVPAVIEAGLRDDAHEPDAATAVDQPAAFAREQLTEFARGFDVALARAEARPAEDCDLAHCRHSPATHISSPLSTAQVVFTRDSRSSRPAPQAGPQANST